MPIPREQETIPITCGHCTRGIAAQVVFSSGGIEGRNLWLRCPSCGGPSVKADNIVYPTAPAGSAVPNLSPEVERAWREVRTAHAVAAYTAAEIMCRKILMHIAVDKASSAPNKRFVEYVEDLDTAGYISTGLKVAVTKVKDRGNFANHELPASTEQDSLTTMAITEYLLRGMYELPAL